MAKKTFNIDEQLLREARDASRARTGTETIRLGLEALIRSAAYQRLLAYAGSEPYAQDVPRRRPEILEPESETPKPKRSAKKRGVA